MQTINQRLAQELNAREAQITATVALMDEGASVPFIARYRKEVTGGLDDSQLRLLDERLSYLRELEARREAILASLAEQNITASGLLSSITEADSKQRLEDLYLPYKPKRRTKAMIAREAGIEPLALKLLAEPQHDPGQCAVEFINEPAGFADSKAVLDGARQILMERFAENATLLSQLRLYLKQHAKLSSRVIETEQQSAEAAKFRDWFEFQEHFQSIPSHRALALLRGRNSNILRLAMVIDAPEDGSLNACEYLIAVSENIRHQQRPADDWLRECVRWCWRVKLSVSLELELLGEVRERAEDEAILVFAENLRNLLLAAPAGAQNCIGLDPGIRTGVKVAVVDHTGKLLETTTVYPHAPRNDWAGSVRTLSAMVLRHQVRLIAIGNGTASRETDSLATDLLKTLNIPGLQKVLVSEAGASVYSASELAASEFPELDVSLRGAVSIARRLQDPLAELVKIDPKSIGVGQYQHDVNASKLSRRLQAVVEDCVNAVGVDLNTASPSLLENIAGLNKNLAKQITQHRNSHGRFDNRQQLLDVPRLGQKAYEQAAGFLRIRDGSNPLDSSAVHPEAYPVVEQILAELRTDVKTLLGKAELLRLTSPEKYTNERFGLPTVQDIFRELSMPGRDPRPSFQNVSFRADIQELKDLKPDMVLEGKVSNVTNFGAFVDIGVHQDGLVHISALADRYINDPHSVVKTGDIVKVKVLEIDLERRRVALSMRLSLEAEKSGKAKAAKTPFGSTSGRNNDTVPQQQNKPPQTAPANAMAAAFAKLQK